jgi:hypothetical protein
VRDLLTSCLGFGSVMALPDSYRYPILARADPARPESRGQDDPLPNPLTQPSAFPDLLEYFI